MRYALFALLVCLLSMCSRAPVDTFVSQVDPSGWSSVVGVEYINSDTVGVYDVSMLINYDSRLNSSEFYVNITMLTPDSLMFTERLRVVVERAARQTFRSEEQLVPYRYSVILPRKGLYCFEFKPQKRIEGVRAVGLKITKR